MGSVYTGHSTLYLVLSYLGYNQAGNYSTINCHLYQTASSGWSGYASGIGWSVAVPGTSGASGTKSFNGTSIDWANFNINIPHNAAGYYSGSAAGYISATGTQTFGGPASVGQAISVPRIPKAPGIPGTPTLTSVTTNSILFKISGPSDNGGSAITTYNLQASKSSSFSTIEKSWSSGETNQTADGLDSATKYYIRYRAVNAIGTGGWSSALSATTKSAVSIYDGSDWASEQPEIYNTDFLGGPIEIYDGTNWVDPG